MGVGVDGGWGWLVIVAGMVIVAEGLVLTNIIIKQEGVKYNNKPGRSGAIGSRGLYAQGRPRRPKGL